MSNYNPLEGKVSGLQEALGIAWALIDYVALHRCAEKNHDEITMQVSAEYPMQSLSLPSRYTKECYKRLLQRSPNNDAFTARLMDRVAEMMDIIGDNAVDDTSGMCTYYNGKSHYYLGTYAAKLKRERVAHGLSQSQVADKSGVSLRTLQSFEQAQRDIRRASIGTVQSLANAIGCAVDDIV